MGTLGCIHDMMRRDKENREIPPTLSVEKLEKIKKQTQEKERADRKQTFRITLYVGLIVLFLLLLSGIFLR